MRATEGDLAMKKEWGPTGRWPYLYERCRSPTSGLMSFLFNERKKWEGANYLYSGGDLLIKKNLTARWAVTKKNYVMGCLPDNLSGNNQNRKYGDQLLSFLFVRADYRLKEPLPPSSKRPMNNLCITEIACCGWPLELVDNRKKKNKKVKKII